MLEFLNAEYICYVLAPAVALLVQALKGFELVARNPKAAAAVLSAIASIVAGWTFLGLDWAMIAECTIMQAVGSVGLYEWIVKPVARQFSVEAF